MTPIDKSKSKTNQATENLFKRIAKNKVFTNFISVVIILNAITIGMSTYSFLEDRIGLFLSIIDNLFLWIFVVELVTRLLSFGKKPWRYFMDGWNIFDFSVVFVSLLPIQAEYVTVFRLIRLLRVIRLIRVFPELQRIIRGFLISLKPIFYLFLLLSLFYFIYGVLGYYLFHDDTSENFVYLLEGDPTPHPKFGSLHETFLTLFQITTVEGWNDYLFGGLEKNGWAWIYFVSFIIIGTFIFFNMIVGIIVNSMESAAVESPSEKEDREEIDGESEEDTLSKVTKQVVLLKQQMNDLEEYIHQLKNESKP